MTETARWCEKGKTYCLYIDNLNGGCHFARCRYMKPYTVQWVTVDDNSVERIAEAIAKKLKEATDE